MFRGCYRTFVVRERQIIEWGWGRWAWFYRAEDVEHRNSHGTWFEAGLGFLRFSGWDHRRD